MGRREVIIALVLVIVVVIIWKVVQFWRRRFGKVNDVTSVSVFGDNAEIIELPQHHIETQSIKGADPEHYRSYNPSVTLLGNELLYSFRISNYVFCAPGSGKAQRSKFIGGGRNIKNYTMLSRNDNEVVLLDLPDPAPSNCVAGFEDPRLIVSEDGNTLIVVTNSRSNSKCITEMHLVQIPVEDLNNAFNWTSDVKILEINNNQILKLVLESELDLKESERPSSNEKNWMPFFDQGKLHFVYSIEPHVILTADMETGICSVSHQTTNKHVNPKLRGGSQVRRYGDNFIAIGHWRTSSMSYLNQAYMFQNKPPYRITGITPTFIIDDKSDETTSLIQFVSGFEIKDDVAYITYGENDCDSKLLTMPIKSLISSMKDPAIVAESK